MIIDRTEASRALARAISFKAVGKHDEANEWAMKLVAMLSDAGILKDRLDGANE